MSSKPMLASDLDAGSVVSDQISSVSILAVGEPGEWTQQGNPLPSGGMAFISFNDVSEAMLAHYNPSVVFSPVLAAKFDCIELALLLHNLGFSGAYRAMAKDLPKPELIEREVSQMCPRLDFSIVIANC